MANVISYKGQKYVRVDELSDKEKQLVAKLEKVCMTTVKELKRIERRAGELSKYYLSRFNGIKADPEAYDLEAEFRDRKKDLSKLEAIQPS